MTNPMQKVVLAVCLTAAALWAGDAHAEPTMCKNCNSDSSVRVEDEYVVIATTWTSNDERIGTQVLLAAPLPAGTELTGVQALRDAQGRVVALQASPGPQRPAGFELRVPLAQVRETQVLPLALPAGDALHRVVLDRDLAFTPAARSGLVAKLGRYSPTDVGHRASRRVDRAVGDEHIRLGALYLPANATFVRAGGLQGKLTLRAERGARLALGIGGLFVVLVVLGGLGYRRLRRQVEVERAEAYLEKEFGVFGRICG